MKPTFQALLRDGTTAPVEYTPLIVIAGSETHKLALHKNPHGIWAVSDPKSGAGVIRAVDGQYKGIRVSSRGLTLKEIRQLALADVENLIARIGSEKFNAVLAAPAPF